MGATGATHLHAAKALALVHKEVLRAARVRDVLQALVDPNIANFTVVVRAVQQALRVAVVEGDTSNDDHADPKQGENDAAQRVSAFALRIGNHTVLSISHWARGQKLSGRRARGHRSQPNKQR